MRGLLWKDYRLNRGLLGLGVVGLAAVYLVGFVTEFSHTWPAMPAPQAWADALCSYGHVTLAVLPYLAGLLGGNAIACERADRSANFLAYLPPSKWRILASKCIVAVCAMTIFWTVSLLLMYAIAPLLAAEPADFMYMLGSPRGALAGCIATFGVGWLGSACFEKPTIPVLAALVTPVVLAMVLFTLSSLLGISRFEVAAWGGAVSLGIGIVAFVAGCWSYLRRVEP